MKKILLLLFLATGFANVYAQDERLDELPFKEEETIEEKAPYFGLGGGFTGTYLLLNNDELNKYAVLNGFSELGKPFLTGGQGFTGIPWIKNMRIGLTGFGGSQSKSNSVLDTTGGNTIAIVKKVEQQISNIGLSLGYGIVVTKSLAIIPEVTFSSASHKIIFSKTSNQEFDYNDIPNTTKSVVNSMDNSFIAITPAVNIEWAATNFLMLRASAGYNYQVSSSWKLNGEQALKNVPDALNTNGVFAQFGLFIGLFNY